MINWRNKILWITLSIVVLFVALRIPFLNKEYVFEETFLVRSAEQIAEVGYPEYYVGEQLGKLEVNLFKPPLFAATLALMYKIFGSSEIVSRSVPLIFNLGTLLLLIAFAKRFFGSKGMAIGLFAATLFAAHPFFIQNSIQIDLDGGIISFLTMLFVYLSARYLSLSTITTKNWIVILLSFFFLFATKIEPALMTAFAVFFWLAITKKSLRLLIKYCLALAIPVATFFALFYLYNYGFGHSEQTWSPIVLILLVFDRFFIPRFQGEVIDVHQLKAWQESLALFSIYVTWIAPPFLLALGVLLIRKIKRIVKHFELLLLFLWFAVMAGTYFLIGNTGPGYPRYLAPMTVPLFLFLGYFSVQAWSIVVARKKYTGLLLTSVGIFILYLLAPTILFLERKLVINLELLNNLDKLFSVARLAIFWVLVFVILLTISFWRKINWEKSFIITVISLLIYLPFAYVHDVKADHSLTNVYGQSGFRDAGSYLQDHLSEEDIILTNDTVGYYYNRRYFDMAFSIHSDESSYEKLEKAFEKKEIAAIAISEEQMIDFLSDPISSYRQEFKLARTFGSHPIFIRK